MTREEAFSFIHKTLQDKTINYFHLKHIIVNKIYDYFESRTCENCKHYQEHTYHSSIKTEATKTTIIRCQELHINKGKDFGCNKWEKRD